MGRKKKKQMTVKEANRYDENGRLKLTGAEKRENELARERFFRKPYGKVWQETMELQQQK